MSACTPVPDHPAVQFRIARPTNNLERVVEFYRDGLGLPVLYKFEKHAGYSGVMVGLPGIQHHLEFTTDEKGTSGTAPTKDNLLVLYFGSEEELGTVRSRLTRLNYKPVEPENPYWTDKGLTFEDPDGWRVVLCNRLFLPDL